MKVVISSAILATVCLAGCQPSTTNSVEQAVGAICDLADGALRSVTTQQSVDGVAGAIEQIRLINNSLPEADGIWWQVSQLADAWDGYIALRAEPELTDGGTAVAASLQNLVRYCTQ